MFTNEPQLLKLKYWPDPILSEKSKPVMFDVVDHKEVQELMNNMVKTLQEHKAVGLAAIQVGVPLQILVIQDEEQKPIKVINPYVRSVDGEQFGPEGCLSVPGLTLRIRRPQEAVVDYMDENGERHMTVMGDLLGRAITHEMDHFEGKMFWDNLSKLERSMAIEKYKKIKRKFKLD